MAMLRMPGRRARPARIEAVGLHEGRLVIKVTPYTEPPDRASRCCFDAEISREEARELVRKLCPDSEEYTCPA